MYKVAICDDEAVFVDDVSEKLKKIADDVKIEIVILRYYNGQELADDIRSGKVETNLVIFDVVLGQKNGIDLACALKDEFPLIKFIFITAFNEYILDGYEAEPAGFLIKPIDAEKLKSAFLRAYKAYTSKNVVIKDNSGRIFSLNVDLIDFIEVSGRNLSIKLRDGKSLNIVKSLSEFLGLLPSAGFVQCHRSYVVALDAIESVKRYELTMHGGRTIPVSKLKYTEIQKAMIERYSSH